MPLVVGSTTLFGHSIFTPIEKNSPESDKNRRPQYKDAILLSLAFIKKNVSGLTIFRLFKHCCLRNFTGMTLTKDDRINGINIGLMLLSCVAAFIMPFEVFLFAYAVMGPLHYLTEISWLHDRQYFAKGKYDYLVLLLIGVVLALWDFAAKYKWWPFNSEENMMMARDWNIYQKLMFIAFFSGIIVAFVKNHLLKIAGIAFVFFISVGIYGQLYNDQLSETGNEGTLTMLLTSFVPTLIHVYVFTGFFMLFGALKTRSRSGLWSVLVFVICPLLLFFLFSDHTFIPVSSYGKTAYGDALSTDGFFGLNKEILERFFDKKLSVPATITTNEQYQAFYNAEWSKMVYHSSTGILVTRFIAFAYTYHYLNWFSKTEVIRWHKIPKARFAVVIILWLISAGLYAYDYKVGLQWLFFLSFTHVLLEFPLNMISITGIGKELVTISKNGFKPVLAKSK